MGDAQDILVNLSCCIYPLGATNGLGEREPAEGEKTGEREAAVSVACINNGSSLFPPPLPCLTGIFGPSIKQGNDDDGALYSSSPPSAGESAAAGRTRLSIDP